MGTTLCKHHSPRPLCSDPGSHTGVRPARGVLSRFAYDSRKKPKPGTRVRPRPKKTAEERPCSGRPRAAWRSAERPYAGRLIASGRGFRTIALCTDAACFTASDRLISALCEPLGQRPHEYQALGGEAWTLMRPPPRSCSRPLQCASIGHLPRASA